MQETNLLYSILLLNPGYKEMGVPWQCGSKSVEMSRSKRWSLGWGHCHISAFPEGDRLGWCFEKLCEVANVLWRMWCVLENITTVEMTCWSIGNSHRPKCTFSQCFSKCYSCPCDYYIVQGSPYKKQKLCAKCSNLKLAMSAILNTITVPEWIDPKYKIKK